jgi:hypothetical protein
LQGPIEASSQAAVRAFMDLSEKFEDVTRLSDEANDTLSKPANEERTMNLSLSLSVTPMASQLVGYFPCLLCFFTEFPDLGLRLLGAFTDYLGRIFDIQRHILLELGARAKRISPQGQQETLCTFRELFCVVNSEDISHLKGAVNSLRGLWKIRAEKENSYEKTKEIKFFFGGAPEAESAPTNYAFELSAKDAENISPSTLGPERPRLRSAQANKFSSTYN